MWFLLLCAALGFLLGLLSRREARAQGCHDPTLRARLAQVAQHEGVDEKELLSVIAHESGCRYSVVAWNLPKRPETAQSRFFSSLEETKAFAGALIAAGGYRVDVGIGQINNEAHIQPRRWTLDEVLDPATALHRVAAVLKVRGWAHYHSSNPVYARRWQALALAALDRALSKELGASKARSLGPKRALLARAPHQDPGALIIFNRLPAPEPAAAGANLSESVTVRALPVKAALVVFNSGSSPNPAVNSPQESPWIVYGSL